MTKEKFFQEIVSTFDVPKYCKQFNIRQSRLKGIKKSKGVSYVRKLYVGATRGMQAVPKNYTQQLKIVRAFTQNGRAFDCFIPSPKEFLMSVFKGEKTLFCNTYKGVSYNPNISELGEKFDNLDFFSWAAYVQKFIPNFEIVIYDASLYNAINLLSENIKIPRKTKLAEWFYNLLLKTKQNYPDFAKNCSARSKYLPAMIKATGIKAKYVSTEMVLGDKKNKAILFKSFRWALKKCDAMIDRKNRLLKINKFVQYRRYDKEFAKSYTPAVVAEAYYFKQFGINSKLGPTSELGFDNIVTESMRTEKISYNLFWYSRPFEGKNSIFMNDTKNVIIQKLKNDPGYAEWINDVVSQFTDKKGVEGVLEIREKIKENLL